ncbi:hypothetical protein [Streptomyces sp. DZ1-3]|uniref:hypothetical protein n=1 Tax=Streptomyces sp. DZ1-3 TaxID=3417466 RepID=UPI003CF4E09B
MNYQPAAAAVVAICGLAGLYMQNRRTTHHAAEEIKRELDIFEALPDDSPLRKPLQERIEDSLGRYMAGKKEGRRDWFGVSLAIFLLAAAGTAITLTVRSGGWWWASLVLALPFALFGTVGFVESITKAERDPAGHRIRADKSPARQ